MKCLFVFTFNISLENVTDIPRVSIIFTDVTHTRTHTRTYARTHARTQAQTICSIQFIPFHIYYLIVESHNSC